jgi:hypothetical protein
VLHAHDAPRRIWVVRAASVPNEYHTSNEGDVVQELPCIKDGVRQANLFAEFSPFETDALLRHQAGQTDS